MTPLTSARGQHGPATAPPRDPLLLSGPRTKLYASAVALLFTAVAARGNRVGACEERTFRAINGLPDALYPPGWVVMQLGSLGAAPATAGAAWLAGDRKLAGRLLTVGSVTWMLSKGVKHAVRRDRPATLLPDIRSRGRDAAGLGYLSGHAGVAFALGAAALPRLSRPGRVLAMGAAPAVALARVYVGAHLPLDIIGGAALGLAVEAGLTLLTADPPPREASEDPPARSHHLVSLPGDAHRRCGRSGRSGRRWPRARSNGTPSRAVSRPRRH